LRDMAGSLSLITAVPVDTAAVAAAMIDALYQIDQGLLTEKTAIMDRYRTDCVTVGKEVSIHRFEEVRHGTAVSTNDEGALLVRFPDGHTESIAAGEVSIRGMYGYVN